MISVVIPYYNSQQTIGRALESCVKQTYADYEIILVDDGSTDETHQRVEAYIGKHPKIRFRHYAQENQGPSEARNLGMHRAEGEYIAFLDSDDSWMGNKLEIQMQLLEREKMDLLGSNVNIIEPDGNVIRQRFVKRNLEYISFQRLLFKHYFYASSVVVRKTVVDAMGGFPEKQKYAEDTLLFSRITRKHKAAVSKDLLVNVYKPLFGGSGLSADLEKTHKYIVRNIMSLKRENDESARKIGGFAYLSALVFSLLRYYRRRIISKLRRAWPK